MPPKNLVRPPSESLGWEAFHDLHEAQPLFSPRAACFALSARHGDKQCRPPGPDRFFLLPRGETTFTLFRERIVLSYNCRYSKTRGPPVE